MCIIVLRNTATYIMNTWLSKRRKYSILSSRAYSPEKLNSVSVTGRRHSKKEKGWDALSSN